MRLGRGARAADAGGDRPGQLPPMELEPRPSRSKKRLTMSPAVSQKLTEITETRQGDWVVFLGLLAAIAASLVAQVILPYADELRFRAASCEVTLLESQDTTCREYDIVATACIDVTVAVDGAAAGGAQLRQSRAAEDDECSFRPCRSASANLDAVADLTANYTEGAVFGCYVHEDDASRVVLAREEDAAGVVLVVLFIALAAVVVGLAALRARSPDTFEEYCGCFARRAAMQSQRLGSSGRGGLGVGRGRGASRFSVRNPVQSLLRRSG